jgi:anti-sigma regulatory factor (Ser/Thr protein kinase)
LRFGIASRPISDRGPNGDAHLVKEWSEHTLLAVIDGLGHGHEAAVASRTATEYVLANHTRDVEQIITGLQVCLRATRGAAASLVRVDGRARRLALCGAGNIEARIIGEPAMHPTSMDGVLGLHLRKVRKFEYQYNSLRAVLLHSDGISSRFDLADYPLLYKQPQEVAEQIMAKYGKANDDATLVIAVEDLDCIEPRGSEVEVNREVHVLLAVEQAEHLAKALGFTETDRAEIAIATSELARNILVHAGGKGKVAIKPVTEADRVGVILIAEDRGPGIADVKRALQGGSSSKNGLGEGLAGAKRLMDEFEIETSPEGTRITATKWKHQRPR